MFENSEISVSVIVPVYGVERYIERCARSLFGQTMTEGVEFIFVDDCSTDGSISILQRLIDEYPELQTTILHHDRNKGLPTARLTGLKAARGEYVLHVDSDDWVERDMIESLYMAAKEKDADVAVCDYYLSSGNSEKPVIEEISADCYLDDMLKLRATCYVWTKFVRRKIYDSVEFPIASMFEDVVIMFQVNALTNKRVAVRKPLYHYSQTENSISRDLSNEAQLKHRGKELLQNMELLERRLSAFGVPSSELVHIKANAMCTLLPLTSSREGYKYYKSIYESLNFKFRPEKRLGRTAIILHTLAPLGMYRPISRFFGMCRRILHVI